MEKIMINKAFYDKLTSSVHSEWVRLLEYILTLPMTSDDAIWTYQGNLLIRKTLIDEYKRQVKTSDCFLYPMDRDNMRRCADMMLDTFYGNDNWQIEDF